MAVGEVLVSYLLGLALVASTGVAAVLAVVVRRRGDTAGARPLVGFLLGVAVWSLTKLAELASGSFGSAYAFHMLSHLAALVVLVLQLVFVVEYTGYRNLLTRRRIGALSLPVLAIWLLTVVNPERFLLYRSLELVEYGAVSAFSYELAPEATAFIVYAFLLATLGYALLVRFVLQARNLYRKQALVVFGSFLVTPIGMLFWFAGLTPIRGLDVTMVFFTVQGLGITLALYRYDFLDVAPLASDILIEEMDDAVVVLDDDERVIDHNPAAIPLLDDGERYAGRPIGEIAPGLLAALRHGETVTVSEGGEVTDGGLPTIYEPRVTPINDRFGRQRGTLLVLRDVTVQKRRERRLQAIHRISHRLMKATDRSEIADVTASAAENVLDRPVAGLFLRSEDDDGAASGRDRGGSNGNDDGGGDGSGTESGRDNANGAGDGTDGSEDEGSGADGECQGGDDGEREDDDEGEGEEDDDGEGEDGGSADEETALVLAGATSALENRYQNREVKITPEDASIWEVYRKGNTRSLTESETGLPGRLELDASELLVSPLGEHGVFLIAVTTDEDHRRDDVRFATILARAAEAALDRARRERQLRESRRTIKERTEQIEFFNGLLRHELLNGLLVVNGNLELLEDHVEPEGRRFYERVERWSRDITTLTESVRSVIREITSESTVRDLETVELLPVIEEKVDKVRETHGEVTVEADLTAADVRADGLLGEVIENLLHNAIEHNDTDNPTLVVSTVVTDEHVRVRIADDGPGVPDEDKGEIFRKDVTAESSGSVGFGLYFVRIMMDKYGGRAWFEDNDPRGAVAVLELQRAEGTDSTEEPAVESDP